MTTIYKWPFRVIFFLCILSTVNAFANPHNLYTASNDSTEHSSQTEHKTLEELVVSADRNMTKLIEGGYSYNLSQDKRARKDNLYDALNYVPFVKAGLQDITVYGSSGCTIYLNGRPYDFANMNPMEVLKSLPASKISKIEVITDVTEKYGVISAPIINIVSKGNVLDGYSVNVGGSGSSKPDAGGKVFAMGASGNVELAAAYRYDLMGQRNQKMWNEYTYLNGTDTTSIVNSDGVGRGNWHSHTIRFMFKWNIDSINRLYADVHGLLRHTTSRNRWSQETTDFQDESQDVLNYIFKNSENSGALESNVIFRNYFRHRPQQQRFSLGYRYTYSPDRHTYVQTYPDNHTAIADYRQKIKGGMNEHTVSGSFTLLLPKRQNISLEAREVFRLGNTTTHSGNPGAEKEMASMRYHQYVTRMQASYVGMFNRITLGAWITGEYCNTDAKMPLHRDYDYNRNDWNFIPSMTLIWAPDYYTSLRMDYVSSTTRPSLSQLNPYREQINGYLASEGNPNLKTMQTNGVRLSAFKSVGKFSMRLTGLFSWCDNAILQYPYMDGEVKVSTFGNIGKIRKWSVDFNCDWSPKNFVSLSLYSSFGKNYLSSKKLDARQKDWFYSITPMIDFYLPYQWRLGAQCSFSKSAPDLFSYNNRLIFYSAYVRKSFWNGKLSLDCTVHSPFAKHVRAIAGTRLPEYSYRQTNFINARYVEFGASYTFGYGKKVSVEKDTSLENNDLRNSI